MYGLFMEQCDFPWCENWIFVSTLDDASMPVGWMFLPTTQKIMEISVLISHEIDSF